MAKLNFDYYQSNADDVYTDGDIENDLLHYAKSGECDWYQDGRWPIVYHMSHLRHNILNWFPFKENCSILEIGAGCGALTGLLCEHAAKVVSVELTKRRADVNFHRHQHWDNLEIVVCDFQSIPSEWKFDYIVINGVLEYAAYMINSKQPYEDFLKISAEHMNPSGRMLLSIENRLGLKYFSGAKEDHTGKYFSGLNGYVEGENVRTFSKEELYEQICNAKLYPLKFYYPYPDYKFPAEIFTDATVCNMTPTVSNYPLDMPRAKLFDEQVVYQSLMKQGIMDKFSNSFLVEIALESNEIPAEMSYVKLSANRNERFRICTYFDGDKKNVYKKALTLQAEEHLKRMKDFNDFEYSNSRIRNTDCKEEQMGISYPYITGDSLEVTLLNDFNNLDKNDFYAQIKQFRDELFSDIKLKKQPISDEFEEIFGVLQCTKELHWVSNANVDMISGNIFKIKDKFQVIDYEWHVSCEVPQEFILWRMLKQLIEDHQLESILNKASMYELINIDEQVEKCFFEWEDHFAKNYVGIKDLYYLAKDSVPLDIELAVARQIKEHVLQSTLFFDLGNGFTDFNYESINAVYTSTGFAVTFTQEKLKLAKLLRWDPLEGSASNIKIQNIETDGKFESIVPINAERFTEDIGYEFFTYDPQFQLNGDFSGATYMKIYFSCNIMDWTVGYQTREEEMILFRQKTAEQELINQRLITEFNELQQASNKTQAKLDMRSTQLSTLQMEMSSKLEELEIIKMELSSKQEELETAQIDLLKLQKDLLNKQSVLSNTQNTLQTMIIQMKEHRVKSIIKILLFGNIFRGKKGE
ncbi:methyltransferase domain-containing protein [Paenibacillus alba]|uniref:class I SAM-dependent methyltransferase n=1 Tax=Paenibacillus alba TaxID=1197127 RepID=UPI0015645832|nr:class I SAM-dependent methyltransferase [Paenibacillus alba]NQX66693.1 methyltransferase domain-containing protein [Paenibacillus alba]